MLPGSIINYLSFLALTPAAFSMVHDKIYHQDKRATTWNLQTSYQGSSFFNGMSFVRLCFTLLLRATQLNQLSTSI
jgi:hypothetical protein